MVDRIDKTDRLEAWKVQTTAETHKDKGQQDQEQPEREGYGSLYDKTDWQVLLDKSRLWKKNIQIPKQDIQSVLFRKVNLKTDPSLLRVDILLRSGETVNPAFLSVSRSTALQMKNLNPGDVIPESLILRDSVLRVTIPSDPRLFAEEEKKEAPVPVPPPVVEEESTMTQKAGIRRLKDLLNQSPLKAHLRPEIAVLYGILALALLLMLGGALMLI